MFRGWGFRGLGFWQGLLAPTPGEVESLLQKRVLPKRTLRAFDFSATKHRQQTRSAR